MHGSSGSASISELGFGCHALGAVGGRFARCSAFRLRHGLPVRAWHLQISCKGHESAA